MSASNRTTLLSFVFFIEGSVAAALGDPPWANPYQAGTTLHDRWREGWDGCGLASTPAGEPDAAAG